MTRRRACRRRVVGAVAGFATVAALAALGAEMGAAQSRDRVVMSGLDNPRGLTFADPSGRTFARARDHRGSGRRWALYVAEAGTGGTLRCTELRGTVCVGRTGAVSRYWRGEQTRIVEGLPSYAPFAMGASAGAVGPHDVSFAGGRGYVVIGLAAHPDARAALGEKFGWIAGFGPSGRVSYRVDVSDHEKQANPDQGPVESNPYGLLEGAGKRLVVDAAGNTLVGVDSSGRISTRSVFPSRAQGRNTDAVPTAVTVGRDGAYYVGELTGAPFAPSEARIWRVVPGQAAQVHCSGFSFIIDLDFDRRGNLYVLEHASGLRGPFMGTPGQLLRVGGDCNRTPVRTGLVAPTSVAIGPDGDAYASVNGTSPASGAVIRIELDRHAHEHEDDDE